MSNDWFRSWHGAPTDNKWLLIGRLSHTPPGVVAAIAWALLDHASQQADRGDVSTFDIETYSVFSGFEEEKINSVIDTMKAKKIIIDGRLANWEKRQPKREDNKSTERVREYRKRNETQCNTVQHNGTLDKRREEERREDIPPLPPVDAFTEMHFETFFRAYPGLNKGKSSEGQKGTREEARQEFRKAVLLATPEHITAQAQAYGNFLKRTNGIAKAAVNWLTAKGWETNYALRDTNGGRTPMPSPAGG